MCVHSDKCLKIRLTSTYPLPLPQYSWAFFFLAVVGYLNFLHIVWSEFLFLSIILTFEVSVLPYSWPLCALPLSLYVLAIRLYVCVSPLGTFHCSKTWLWGGRGKTLTSSFFLFFWFFPPSCLRQIYLLLRPVWLSHVPVECLPCSVTSTWRPKSRRHVHIHSGNLPYCFCFVSILTENSITNSNNQ